MPYLACLVLASSLGCEAIAGYDSREPWPDDASGPIPADDPDAIATDGAPSDAASSTCLAPNVRCGDECVDLSVSLDHCGRCGNHCPDGATCASIGEGFDCVCAGGKTACGPPGPRRCVDTTTAHDDCGACGVRCKPAQACVSGTCVCASGTLDCGGKCVDPKCDPLSCGGCGVACGAVEYCAGDTGCTCRPGLTRCGGECVDTNGDSRHCGGCGEACNAGSSCRGGSCKPNCAGSTACTVAGVVHCVDTQRDVRHCGGCGKACSATELCIGGKCVGYAPAVACTACPCASCEDVAPGSACCPPLPGQPSPICVSGGKCP